MRITIDRFQVMKNFQERLTAARRELQRHLPREEAQAVKGTRWLLLTNKEKFTAAEQAELAKLGERYPLPHARAGAWAGHPYPATRLY